MIVKTVIGDFDYPEYRNLLHERTYARRHWQNAVFYNGKRYSTYLVDQILKQLEREFDKDDYRRNFKNSE